MKIFTEIEELLGKKTYRDNRLERLRERFNSAQIKFFTVEFINETRETCDCILVKKEKSLDLIVEDIEGAESLLEKGGEKNLINKSLEILNRERFLFQELEARDLDLIKNYGFVTAKPIIIWEEGDLSFFWEEIFKKTSSIFFFTVNKNEARACLLKKGENILAAAGKIHSDLARGFIKGEVYNVKDLDSFKNLDEAKQRGILKIVDRDYIMEDADVINIKFKC